MKLYEVISNPSDSKLNRVKAAGGKVARGTVSGAKAVNNLWNVVNKAAEIYKMELKNEIMQADLGMHQTAKLINLSIGNLRHALRYSEPGQDRKEQVEDTLNTLRQHIRKAKEENEFGKEKKVPLTPKEISDIKKAYQESNNKELLKQHLGVLEDISNERVIKHAF